MTIKRGEAIPDEMILSRMEGGDRLTLARIASRLNMGPDRVRTKLLGLLAQGKVKRERDFAARNTPYLYFVEHPQIIAGGEFEIPTPFVGVNLEGDLVGYDAALNSQASLCMSIRRAT